MESRATRSPRTDSPRTDSSRTESSRTGTEAPDSEVPWSGGPLSEEGLDEGTIVARAQDGDLVAFKELVESYQRVLFRVCFRMLNDRGEAEDAVQETLVTAWRKLPELDHPAAFRGWVYQVATRHCIAVIKLRSRRQTQPTSDQTLERDLLGAGSPTGDPAEQAEHSARVRGLGEVLATLPADQRACWVLKELHGLSYAEIAQIMSMPVSTVRGCLARARPKLLEGMSSWR